MYVNSHSTQLTQHVSLLYNLGFQRRGNVAKLFHIPITLWTALPLTPCQCGRAWYIVGAQRVFVE